MAQKLRACGSQMTKWGGGQIAHRRCLKMPRRRCAKTKWGGNCSPQARQKQMTLKQRAAGAQKRNKWGGNCAPQARQTCRGFFCAAGALNRNKGNIARHRRAKTKWGGDRAPEARKKQSGEIARLRRGQKTGEVFARRRRAKEIGGKLRVASA